ncbi:hypothetical protein [Paenibacillus thiaminolyticus]|nr:hypothetical protein [Paenibacillus thiaminolyticus]
MKDISSHCAPDTPKASIMRLVKRGTMAPPLPPAVVGPILQLHQVKI